MGAASVDSPPQGQPEAPAFSDAELGSLPITYIASFLEAQERVEVADAALAAGDIAGARAGFETAAERLMAAQSVSDDARATELLGYVQQRLRALDSGR